MLTMPFGKVPRHSKSTLLVSFLEQAQPGNQTTRDTFSVNITSSFLPFLFPLSAPVLDNPFRKKRSRSRHLFSG